MFLNKFLPRHLIHAQNISTKTITKATSALFFKPEVQDLLLKLTRVDVDKVFRRKKTGQALKPPEYKFLSTEEVEALREEAYQRAVRKVQVPPVVPSRDDTKLNILAEDKEILGNDICNFVFTDITFGVSDAARIIVVREPNGVLREANTNERHRMNHIYFAKPGSSYKHPEMFEEENLLSLCNRKEYIFILDRACIQFEPDDAVYHRVINTTFPHINENNGFEQLRSTRHFGSLVFFLANNNMIDNLLLNNLHCNMIEDAVWLIKVYQILNPDAKCAKEKHVEGQDVMFIQAYINLDSPNKEGLTAALESYTDVTGVKSGV